MTKPEFSFKVCYANAIVNSETISDITKLKKVLKHIKSKESYIKLPSLNIDSLIITIYTNASFNNLPNKGSQGGQILFITENENWNCPLAWNSSI